VVAFRSAAYLEQGLPRVMADPDVGDVVVVDNSSDPRTAEVVERTAGRVRYVDPGANLGFATACNLGYRSTDDPVVTFLNPDVLLDRGLGDLVKACLADGSVVVGGGLAGGPAETALGNARRRVTLWTELHRAVLGARASLDRRPFGTGMTPVAQVDGAFLMAARTFLDALDGFDERFELYLRTWTSATVHAPAVRSSWTSSGTAPTPAVRALGRSPPPRTASSASPGSAISPRAGVLGAAAAVAITAVEVIVRTLTRQPEGVSVRLRALRLAGHELVRPGSVRVLS
jgi:N-acetylglucosaminyl-diphospho-decaprenol L-rhamnosyltransferase